MKNTVLALLFVALAIPTFGQKVHLTDKTNQWTTLYTVGFPSATQTTQQYTLTGDTLMYGYTFQIISSNGGFVREDTSLGLVYFRWKNPTANGMYEGEQVLYNYNLSPGDTMHHVFYPTWRATSWVVSLDSIQVSGTWHKVWYFEGTNSTTYQLDSSFSYYVIEGIGSTNGIFNPLLPIGRINDNFSTQLTCFSTHGSQPTLSAGVNAFGPYLGGSGYWHTITFDNSTSCALTLAVELTTTQNVQVLPNPITDNSRIVFPHLIQTGSVTVYNTVGQKVLDMPIRNAKEILIGDKVNLPGIYWYRLMTNDGEYHSGKFLR